MQPTDSAPAPPAMSTPKPLISSIRIDALDGAFIVIMALWTLALLVLAGFSLGWDMYWDAMHNQHVAYLVNEHGFVLYRDIFDPNLFGTFLFHILLSKILGYGDLPWRIFDLVWLAGLAVSTWYILRRYDWRPAWVGAVAFPWLYLNQGETQSFQRDYLVLLPISCALLLVLSGRLQGRRWLKSLLIGALFGVAASLKPQAAIGLPCVAWFGLRQDGDKRLRWIPYGRRLAFHAALAAAGFSVPLLLGLFWLAVSGSLMPFVEMVTQYWPIYTKQIFKGAIITAKPGERGQFVWQSLLELRALYGREILALPAVMALCALFDSPKHAGHLRSIAGLIAALVLMYFLQVVLVGNFHPYSWLAMVYFLLLLTSLAFMRPSLLPGTYLPALLVLSAALCLGWTSRTLSTSFHRQLVGMQPDLYTSMRAQLLADFLKGRLQPGDRVQVLDWLGGTERAMVLAGAVDATPFIQDVVLFHGVNEPYVRELRGRFLSVMSEFPPRFVIIVTDIRMVTYDPDDTDEFRSEIANLLSRSYRLALDSPGCKVFERREEFKETTGIQPRSPE
ncbi:MAG: hypothetical protein M5U26_02515 [Planctomycetota bacterium]|nr:hypothetical protein [Planctomycetota bacterium]